MKNKKSTFQKQEVIKRMQKGLPPSFVNYALKESEQQKAKILAAEIGLPFTKIEQILLSYHDLRTSHLELEDKDVIKILETAISEAKVVDPPTGLFKRVKKERVKKERVKSEEGRVKSIRC